MGLILGRVYWWDRGDYKVSSEEGGDIGILRNVGINVCDFFLGGGGGGGGRYATYNKLRGA